MSTGSIRRLLKERGFGFIQNEGGLDLFFHYSQVQGADFNLLREGQNVKFKVGLSHKGLRAVDVKVLEKTGAGSPAR